MRVRQWLVRWPVVVALSVPGLLSAAEATPSPRHQASEARLRRDVTFLASDECEGRGVTTQGIRRAADYIAGEFKKAGLRPAGPDGSYFQPFTMPAAILDAPAHLTLRGPKGETALKQGADFWPLGLGHAGKLTAAPVAFVGYGIGGKDLDYDDYAGLDVEDKVVVVLRDAPRVKDRDLARKFKAHTPLIRKLGAAEKHGAAAVLFVTDAEGARDGDELLDFNYTALTRSPSKLPVFHVRRSVLEALLAGSSAGRLADIEKEINRDPKPHSLDLKGWTVSLEVRMHRGRIGLKNVVGVLEGNGPLANETIVVGAHYDHLGYGGAGGSLANLRKPAIHHGADDNASGTTAMLELARRFAAEPNRQGRRLVFVAFSGEELGLYGSAHYCKEPLFPLQETAAMFNLDMVGRLRPDKKTGKDKVLSEGSGTARPFKELLERLGKKHDFTMINKPSGFGPSDHASFCSKKVPVLFFWTDYHSDYHRPSDTADKINVAGMRRVVDLGQDVVTYLTTVEKRPEFVEVKGSAHGSSPSLNGPRLGFRPSYSDEGEGVLIDGVKEGEPAARAGLKGGDRIVGLAGKPIKGLEAYMQVMSTQKKGTTIDVVILRDGKKQTVKVKLD